MFKDKIERIISKIHAKGGGGGSSGKVDYPDYMKTQHETWLDEIAAHITTAVAATSPYTSAVSYDPDTDIAANATALAAFSTVVNAFNPSSDWADVFDVVAAKLDADDITLNVTTQTASHAAIVDADLAANVLPIFKRSMQNVNANMGSAFVIGEAIITNERNRNVDKFQSVVEMKNADLNLERSKLILNASDKFLNVFFQEVEMYKTVAHYTIEANRIKLAAKKEETETNLEFDVKDAKWDLSMYKEGGNMLAAISGASITQGVDGPSKTATAIGGALSGAAMGGMVGAMTAAEGAVGMAALGNPAFLLGGLALGGIGGLL